MSYIQSRIKYFQIKLQVLRFGMQRLTDLINPEEQKLKLSELRCLKNSFKRNIIQPTAWLSEAGNQIQYQCKLTNHNFRKADLFLLFHHLYQKDEMTVCDRNLIRRILLTVFEDDLIIAAGRHLIQLTKFLYLEAGNKASLTNQFYFLIKGSLTLSSNNYSKKFKGGDYFGHIEIMSESLDNYAEISAHQDSFFLLINSSSFNDHLLKFFKQKFAVKQQIFPQLLKSSIPKIQLLLLLEEMEDKKFDIGQKIIKKSDEINEFYFPYEGSISEADQKVIAVQKKLGLSSCIGLPEFFLSKSKSLSTFYALEKVKIFAIKKSKFQQYFSSNIIKQLQKSAIQLPNISQLSDKKQIQPETPKIKNFLRFRKVKLNFPRYLKTSQSQTRENSSVNDVQQKIGGYLADFMFVKNQYAQQKTKKQRLQYSMVHQAQVYRNDSSRILYTCPKQF